MVLPSSHHLATLFSVLPVWGFMHRACAVSRRRLNRLHGTNFLHSEWNDCASLCVRCSKTAQTADIKGSFPARGYQYGGLTWAGRSRRRGVDAEAAYLQPPWSQRSAETLAYPPFLCSQACADDRLSPLLFGPLSARAIWHLSISTHRSLPPFPCPHTWLKSLSIQLFSPWNPRAQDGIFSLLYFSDWFSVCDDRKQNIVLFEKLEQENVWHVWFINLFYWSIQ